MSIIHSVTNRGYSAVRGALCSGFGISLLLWPEPMLNIIVKIIAAFLIALGLVSLYYSYKERKEEEASNPQFKQDNSLLSLFTKLNIIVYLGFGLLIFIFPSFFVSIMVFLFGAILLLLGAGQLMNLFASQKYTKVSAYFYIVPVIVTVCGVILFFQPFTAKNVLTMLFGGCIAGYGIVELITAWVLRNVKFGKDGRYMETQSVSYEEVNEKSEK